MALPGYVARDYVESMLNEEVQIQPAGIDLRVQKVFRFISGARIGFSTKEISSVQEIPPENNSWFLDPGVYKVRFAEVVKVPENKVALCFPRSSLLRSGVDLRCTVWDPGYVGRGEGLLTVLNPNGLVLEVDARVAQLVFLELTSRPDRLYSGGYKGENLDT